MKIQILSDLHLTDSIDFNYYKTSADLVCIAGDIYDNNLLYVSTPFYPDNWIYIPGNHDFYGIDINNVNNSIKEEMTCCNVSYYGDYRIISTVLWSYVTEKNRLFTIINEHDYTEIKNLTSVYRNNLHELSFINLIKEVKKDWKGKTIIMTHYPPDERCLVTSEFREYELKCDTATNILNEISNYSKIDLWIHGHSHSSFDDRIDGIRVIRNPKGSRNYPNLDFNERLIIEI